MRATSKTSDCSRPANKSCSSRATSTPSASAASCAEWTLRSVDPAAKQDDSLPEGWDPEAPDAWEHVDDLLDFDALVDGLPPRQREVVELLYREGLSPERIADRLHVKRNAVDQALHNAHKKLAEKLRA
jgi:RNA polymerase sigma factor (sigma-70 family)